MAIIINNFTLLTEMAAPQRSTPNMPNTPAPATLASKPLTPVDLEDILRWQAERNSRRQSV